jgi:hypothetical protein
MLGFDDILCVGIENVCVCSAVNFWFVAKIELSVVN